jgi:hypothetical protein
MKSTATPAIVEHPYGVIKEVILYYIMTKKTINAPHDVD